jgi:hypothetical protein
MSTPPKNPGQNAAGASRKGPPVGFTLVETIVTLGVACLLFVAIVAFLINGLVTSTKTAAINDTTTKGRYVFEHLSKELASASDLTPPNFILPSPGNATGMSSTYLYGGFQYRITVGSPGTTIGTTALTSTTIQLSLPPPLPPANLAPQAGDYLKLPFPSSLAATGTPIATNGVSFNGVDSTTGNYNYTITLTDTIANLASVSASIGTITAGQVATIERVRQYVIAADPNNPGTDELQWYDSTADTTPTLIVAKTLPTNQYPFSPLNSRASRVEAD